MAVFCVYCEYRSTWTILNFKAESPLGTPRRHKLWANRKNTLTLPNIRDFFRWYVQRLEELYRLVLDFTAFADNEQRPRYSIQFKTLLTLIHIAIETHLVMTTLPSFLRKMVSFDILDQYAALLTRGSSDSKQTATKFSQLVREDWVCGPVREAL